MADVRRAFALWVTMGVADGEFSAIEKAAIHALEYHYAVVRAVQKEKKGEAKEFSLLEADFFGKVEKIIRDIGPVEKAEKLVALEKLIATVHDVDDKGGKTATPASSIAVRLVAMAMIGMAV